MLLSIIIIIFFLNLLEKGEFLMKTLVIAEKPSVGKDIARVLNCKKSSKGSIEGDKYIVTWAMGHLVELSEPEGYSDKYKSWNMEVLPIIPDKFRFNVISKTRGQFQTVKTLIQRNDIKDIVIATDAGREGELVARLILLMASNKKPVKRLWISSVTDNAIKEGFSRLKNAGEYNNLYFSALARAEADWIVGINATRALTVKFNASLSCGRVQTPTIAIIKMREDEIKNFVPSKYYGITANLKGILFIWSDKKGFGTRLDDKNKCIDIVNKIKNKNGKIVSVKKTLKKVLPPKLYDLTQLQREANLRYNFSAKETLSIMQSLYEKHKVLTYPRTDSRYLTDDIISTISERINSIPKEYLKAKSFVLKNGIKVNKNFVDNSKVSDHHAIIPTEQPVYFDDFNDKERKIYDMVVKRFLAVLYPPYEYEKISIDIEIENELFRASGRKTIKNGYKEVTDYEENEIEEKEQEMLSFKEGDTISFSKFEITQSITKPPARFNEATLLTAMENPVKYMENKNRQLADTLGNTGGLGTVATRADIIEKLFNSFLIEKRGKDIFLTSKGRQLLNLVPKELKSPEMTAVWEVKLEKIANGKLEGNKFLNEIKVYTKNIIEEIKNSNESFKHDNISNTKCTECGKLMLEVTGKKGRMLVCQDRQCGKRITLSLITNARCPQCKKRLELVGEGDSRKFVCSCGYKEKYSSFQKRKKDENNKMDKKSVSKYLKKLNNDTEINNPMKDILKDLKL